MMRAKLLEEIILREQQIVEPDPRAYEDLLNARQRAQLPQELEIITVIGHEMRAGLRREARLAAAGAAHQLRVAGCPPEIRRRAADIVDVALEARQLCQQPRLAQDRRMTPALDDTALMGNNRAEVATTEAAALRDQAELHFLDCRYTACLLIDRMIRPLVRQIIHLIHLRLRERLRRRILHDAPLVILLREPASANGILLEIRRSERLGERPFLRAYSGERGQLQIVINIVESPHAEARPRDILDIFHCHALVQVSRDFQQCTLSHAVDEQIRHAINENRTAHLIRPIIIMGKASQTRLDASDDDWHLRIELPQAIRVDNRRSRWPMTALAARRIRVLVAPLLCSRKLIEQRIHIPRRDEKRETRPSQPSKIAR